MMTDPALERRALALFEAMLEIEEDKREAWIEAESAGDVALKRRVTAIWQAEKHLDLKTGAYLNAADPVPKPERIGAYRIGGVIGSGGMGTVFAADRDAGDFEHSVAIKVIKPGIFTDQLVARFNRERQILARLNHPNIARLFDGGTTEHGQPYIVMERIEGVPLLDWVAMHDPDLINRLELFLQVCAAAGHAHHNLVVHRDLTPANVLVDQEGEAKLIDFGIARPEGEELAATLGGYGDVAPIRALTMTPGFAAPERMAGHAATVLSDIYSAGKMLAELSPDPRPVELDAIIAKSSADDPDARYLSMDMFADDVRAFLTDQPVGAVPDTARYRWGKWVSRNKALTGLAAALAIALVVGSVATGWWWREAVVARDQANARFNEVRGIATFMLFDLYDELEPVSGNTKALSQIADEARAYLERLSTGDDLSPELRLEIARGYLRLSKVSGNPEGANLGRREDAKLYLDRALTDLELLHKSDPDNPEVVAVLGDALYSKAIFLFIAEDDNKGSIAPADRSAEMFKRLSELEPDNPSHRFRWYESRVQAAKPFVWLEQGEKGIARLERIIEEIEREPETLAKEPRALQGLASAYSELGYTQSWHISAVDPAYRAAEVNLDKALGIYQGLYEDGPKSMREAMRLSLITILFKRSLVHYDLTQLTQALVDLDRAESLVQFIINRDPDDDGAKGRLDALYSQKIFVLIDLGRLSDAVALARELLVQRSERLAREPKNPGYMREVAGARQALADALEKSGDKAAACRGYRLVREDWDRIGEVSEINAIDRFNNIDPLTKALESCA